MTLCAAFENFLLSKRLQCCSEKTIKCYEQVVHPFVVFVGSDADVSDVSRVLYNEYIALLVSKKLSRTTLASYVRQLKVFLRWIECEFGLDLETSRLKVPRAYKKVVHIYSDDEIALIFDSITNILN